MKKKVIVITLIIAVALIVGGALLFSKKQIPNSVSSSKSSIVNILLEEFIGQSAQQMLNPLHGVAPANQKSTVADICQGKNVQSFGCYEKYYRNMVQTQGLEATFADLKARYSSNAYVAAQCHPLTHIIGQEAVNKYPNVSEAYLHGDNFCASGYYHGVVEGIAFKMGKAKFFAGLNNVCAGIEGKATHSIDYYSCLHGLGHGLMEITDDQLFDTLNHCDSLIGTWEQQSCYSGVFMENIMANFRGQKTDYLKPSQPLYPCTAVADQYKNTCYLLQSSYILTLTHRDFNGVFSACAQVENNTLRATCYQSLGRDASGSTVEKPSVKDICNLGKNYEQKSNCIIGAVRDFIYYYHSDVQAKQLCTMLTADLQPICSAEATNYYKHFQ